MSAPKPNDNIQTIIDSLELEAQAIAIEWFNNTPTIPRTPGVDWIPFLTAIALSGRKLAAPPDEPEPVSAYFADTPDHGTVPANKAPTKAPGTGGWDWVWYVPEWSHPNYNDRVRVYYDGTRVLRGTTDPATRLRPAMRPEDALRNPTEYAWRWGIHPNEIGGRSHFSPTTYRTRNPLDDFVTQVDMLNDDEKRQAIVETQRRGLGNPADPNRIDPKVLEDMFATAGISTGDRLKQFIGDTLRDGSVNLELLAERYRQLDPKFVNANRNFINNSLNDQNYQRLFFLEMTTDEMIEGNIHTMSDAELGNLTGPLHPWLQREKWESSSWKGSDEGFPRFVYTMNGERREWDVHTNENLWNALQPALQLVTRVLNSQHPHYQAIADARTRQPIPAEQDPRDEEVDDVATVNLTKFVAIHKVDMEKTYEGIRRLDELGYDWQANVNRLLNERLTLDIGSAFFDPVRSEVLKHVVYGFNYRMSSNEGTTTCSLAAEMMWPLLLPGISNSEKLVTSFLIAAALLHEISHAICQCLQWLTQEDFAQPAGQAQEITDELMGLGSELWDQDVWTGEHSFEDCGEAEHGSQLEMEMWGWSVNSLLSEVSKLSRDISTDALTLRGVTWPMSSGAFDRLSLQGASWPVEDYGRPIPIDYLARFFRQEFWDGDFVRYGPWALRQTTPPRHDNTHKLLMRPDFISARHALELFGPDDAQFLRSLSAQLRINGYPVLGYFIREGYTELLKRWNLPRRWTKDLRDWSMNRCSLDARVVTLKRNVRTAMGLNAIRASSEDDQYARYSQCTVNYAQRNGLSAASYLSFNLWRYNIEQSWQRLFREGGTLMVQLSETHRDMQNDIAFLQRMVMEFLSLDHGLRAKVDVYGSRNATTPIGVAFGRANGFMEHALDLTQRCVEISKNPQLQSIQGPWEVWGARFRGNAAAYNQILEMLLPINEAGIEPDDLEWKSTLKTVPSSYWKKRYDRLTVMAGQQYRVVDGRIRDMLDRASGIIERIGRDVGAGRLFPSDSDPNLDDLPNDIQALQVENQKRIEDANNDRQNGSLGAGAGGGGGGIGGGGGGGRGGGNIGGNSIFDVTSITDAISTEATANGSDTGFLPPDAAATVAQAGIPGSDVGIVFGQPTAPRAVPGTRVPPPGTTPATPATPAARRAGRTPLPDRRRSRSVRASANPLGATNAGVASRGADNSNNNSFAGRWRGGVSRFAQDARVMQAFGTATTFSSGRSQQQTAFPPGQRANPALQPFPHPYADYRTTTDDIRNYANDRRASLQGRVLEARQNPYSTAAPYREMGVDMDIDDSPNTSPLKRR